MKIARTLLAAGSILYSGMGAAGTVLFDSTVGVDLPAYAVVSSALTDASLGGFRTAAADDFSVTAAGWRIASIVAAGNYSDPFNVGAAGPASSVNVYIIPKSGVIPSSTNLSGTAVWVGLNLLFTDLGSGDLQINVPDVALPQGNYWLVVQPNIELLVRGQWNWRESSLTPNSGTTQGDESAWFQSAAGYASPITGTATCVGSWGARVTSCQMTRNPDTNPPTDRDLAFRISGAVLVPGVRFDPLALVTTEDGGNVNYSVVLEAPPAAGETVTITAVSNDTTEGTVSGARSFDLGNWSTPQLFTVTPGSSGDGNDGNVAYSIDHMVASNLPAGVYPGVTAGSVNAINNNIDGVATIIVDPSSAIVVSEDGSASSVVTVEAGPDITPAADVDVALTNDNSADVSISAASVTLTAGNGYSTTFTIVGVADSVREATESFSITTGATTSTDAAFNGVNPPDVTGSVLDNNVVSVAVTPSATPLNLMESGPSASIDYVLTAQPTADVSFGLSSSDTSEAVVSGSSTLTFTPVNWQTPQTVSISPVDDPDVDGSQAFSIIATTTSSTDPFWNGVTIATVGGATADNESAAISVDIGDGVVTSEAGGTDSFALVLSAAPTADVNIDVRSSDPGEGLLSLTGSAPFAATQTLTFTPVNWNVAQTVTVQGQIDALTDGDQGYSIITENIVSAAPGYSLLVDTDVADIAATNLDSVGTPIAVPTLSDGMLALLALVMMIVAVRRSTLSTVGVHD